MPIHCGRGLERFRIDWQLVKSSSKVQGACPRGRCQGLLSCANLSILAGTAGGPSLPKTLRSPYSCAAALVLFCKWSTDTHEDCGDTTSHVWAEKCGMGLKRRQEQRYASCITCGSKVDAVHQAYALFLCRCGTQDCRPANRSLNTQISKLQPDWIVPGASFKKELRPAKSIMRLTPHIRPRS